MNASKLFFSVTEFALGLLLNLYSSLIALTTAPLLKFLYSSVTGPLYSGHRSWTQVTLVSNYSCMIPYGEQVWSNAKRMYQEKAYLHWYYKHGLSEVSSMVSPSEPMLHFDTSTMILVTKLIVYS